MFALLKRRMVLVVLGLLLLSPDHLVLRGSVLRLPRDRRQPLGRDRILVRCSPSSRCSGAHVPHRQAINWRRRSSIKPRPDQRPSADVVQLRERFEEALATLKQQKKRGGLGLYEMPWYVIIGAPGSGKTTALVNSGLQVPARAANRASGALRGVGGTRNCDWWFTEEAVLLDTAGRYTTQDSDASADSAGWAGFLPLLKKHREAPADERRASRHQRARPDHAGPGGSRGARRRRAPPSCRAEQGTRHPAARLRARDEVRPPRRIHRVLRGHDAGRPRAGLGHDLRESK